MRMKEHHDHIGQEKQAQKSRMDGLLLHQFTNLGLKGQHETCLDKTCTWQCGRYANCICEDNPT